MFSYKNSNIYRDNLPSGTYDLVIVSLVHQGPEMIYYMAKNIEKYVAGSFLWIAHYNNPAPIDEHSLPPWAWLVRDTVQTEPYARLKTFGITKAIDFAIANTKFTNCMTLSSGSAFFRTFQVPTYPTICLESHEKQFDPSIRLTHTEEIGIEHAGTCSQYLQSRNNHTWQYNGCDSDTEFHSLLTRRNFQWFKGCQWSGQVWPYEVAVMLVTDIGSLYDSASTKERPYYAAEEIILSTYAYNYAKEHSIPISLTEVIIDWNNSYWVPNIERIEYLRNKYIGHAVCKLSDNVEDPIRQYLLTKNAVAA
jgi:hypothetical protein